MNASAELQALVHDARSWRPKKLETTEKPRTDYVLCRGPPL